VLYRQCPVFIIATHVLVVQLRIEDTIKGVLKKFLHSLGLFTLLALPSLLVSSAFPLNRP
jgi:hypothetical protein